MNVRHRAETAHAGSGVEAGTELAGTAAAWCRRRCLVRFRGLIDVRTAEGAEVATGGGIGRGRSADDWAGGMEKVGIFAVLVRVLVRAYSHSLLPNAEGKDLAGYSADHTAHMARRLRWPRGEKRIPRQSVEDRLMEDRAGMAFADCKG